MSKALILALLCSLSIMLGACSVITAPVMDHRNIGTLADDAGIKTNIAAALVKDSPVKATDVNVHSVRGHVFLVGAADNAFRNFAETTAKNTKGVRMVTTHWFQPGTGDIVRDTALETTINSNLLFTRSIPSTLVTVDVWGGHVVLTGLVGSGNDVQRIISTVESLTGVKSVTSYLEVL